MPAVMGCVGGIGLTIFIEFILIFGGEKVAVTIGPSNHQAESTRVSMFRHHLEGAGY